MTKENAERDELGYAVSWKRALSQLYNYTSWLHGYCVINNVAAQKIILKLNKTFELCAMSHLKDEYNGKLKEYRFVADTEKVIELRKQLQQFYAFEFTGGNVNKAKHELESRMKGNRHRDVALIAFHCGIMITLMFVYILLNSIDSI
jgi:hypothetical protein